MYTVVILSISQHLPQEAHFEGKHMQENANLNPSGSMQQ